MEKQSANTYMIFTKAGRIDHIQPISQPKFYFLHIKALTPAMDGQSFPARGGQGHRLFHYQT